MKYRHGAGLLAMLSILVVVLAACGGTSTAPSGSQEVQVTLSEYKITSSVTTFSPGTPYHFVVTNKGRIAHEFMMMPMDIKAIRRRITANRRYRARRTRSAMAGFCASLMR